MNTLKIAAIYTETKQVEKEIELPYYFKNENGNFCKIVTPTHFLTVVSSSTGPLVMANMVQYNKDIIAKGTPCDKEDYESVFSQAMMHLQMLNDDLPVSNEVDENIQIDQMIEAKINAA
jgi:hypothetical protein